MRVVIPAILLVLLAVMPAAGQQAQFVVYPNPGSGGGAAAFPAGWLGVFQNGAVSPAPSLVSVAGGTFGVMSLALPLDPSDGSAVVPQHVSGGTVLFNGMAELTPRLPWPVVSSNRRLAAIALANAAGTRFYAGILASTGASVLIPVAGPTPYLMAFSPDGSAAFYAWNDPAIGGRGRLEVFNVANLASVSRIGSVPLADPLPVPANVGSQDGCSCGCGNFPYRIETEESFAIVPVMRGADVVAYRGSPPALTASHRLPSATGRTNTNLIRLVEGTPTQYGLYALAACEALLVTRFNPDGSSISRRFDVDGLSPYRLARGIVDVQGIPDPGRGVGALYLPVNGPDPRDPNVPTGVMECFLVRLADGALNMYRFQRLVATPDFDYFGSVFWGQNSMTANGLDTVATAYNAITGTPDSMHEFSFAAPAGTRWSPRLLAGAYTSSSSLAPAVTTTGPTAAFTTDSGQESDTLLQRSTYSWNRNPPAGTTGNFQYTQDVAAPPGAGAPADNTVAVAQFPAAFPGGVRLVVQRPDGAGGGLRLVQDLAGAVYLPAGTPFGTAYSAMIDFKASWSGGVLQMAYAGQAGMIVASATPGSAVVSVHQARFLGPEGNRIRHSEITTLP